MYATRFQVISKFPFPVDMLRYDQVYPRSADDAAVIEASLNQTVPIRDRAPYVVTLVRHHERSFWEPTEGRWNSFNWSVVRDSVKATI